MRFVSDEQVGTDTMKVVSLFGGMDLTQEMMLQDPLTTLIEEAQVADEVPEERVLTARTVVNEGQFPDQSMYVLEEQLKNLRSNLKRISFYLDGVEDLLPG